MKKLLLCLPIGLALSPQISSANIRFVAPVTVGSGDGSSWNNASNDLQAMINASSSIDGDTVFVAAGVYKPNIASPYTANTTNRYFTFALRQNIKIFGHFAGNEADLASRDVYNVTNKTILSGDLNNDDGLNFTNFGENVYHVVVSSGNVGSAILNGFTISGGNANGTESINTVSIRNYCGGGIFLSQSSPTISNCVVTGNTTGGGGAGGMMNLNGAAPLIINCNFIGNNSPVNCGGMTNSSSSPTIIGCAFIGNSSGGNGGAMGNFGGAPVIVNCTFSGNKATFGGAITGGTSGSNQTIINTIIWGNSSGIVSQSGTPIVSGLTISNSLVQGITATTNGNLNGNTTDPLFGSATSYTNAPFTTGNYQLQDYSPCINKGTNTISGVTLPNTDLAGNPRIIGTTIDMGAYESLGIPLALNVVAFQAKMVQNNVQLQWKCVNDAGIPLFKIERSTDGKVFESIGTVEGKTGNASYTIYDNNPSAADLYYRLKTSIDNSSFYSNVIFIHNTVTKSAVSIFPIPATSSVTITNTDVLLNGTKGYILDMNGRTVREIEISASLKLSTKGWPASTYMLRLQNNEIKKIVVE